MKISFLTDKQLQTKTQIQNPSSGTYGTRSSTAREKPNGYLPNPNHKKKTPPQL